MSSTIIVAGVARDADVTTIAAAIERSVPGDTIILHGGVYEELVLLPHDVTLQAAEPTATSPSEDAVEVVIMGNVVVTANVTLIGVEVRGCVDVRKGHAIVQKCNIHDGLDGVCVSPSAVLTMRSSRVHSCIASGDGVYFMAGASGELDDCDIFECRVNGIHVKSSRVIVRNTRIRDCSFGIYYESNSSGVCENNTIEHVSKFGFYIVEDSDPVIRANTVRECGILCALVSKNGKSRWSDNRFEGSIHVHAGCAVLMGENQVSGMKDIDAADVVRVAT